MVLGAQKRSHSGSVWNWLIVGGTLPVVATSMETANSSAPAPPRRCPVIDLVEPKMSDAAWLPKTALTAWVSAMSPWGVEVPCALMYPTTSGRRPPSARHIFMAR